MPSTSVPEANQVFLSYSRSDQEAAAALRAALQQTGLDVFKDDASIRVGDRWMNKLEVALQRCSAFVLLVGRDGVRRWVGAETQVALVRHLSPHDDQERLPIFPILLEDARPEDLPPFIALFQTDRWLPAEALPAGLAEAIQARAIRFGIPPTFEGCPFLGLNAFSQNDSRLFFGRRKETLDALACLGDQGQADPEQVRGGNTGNYHRWLQIEGNSGAGKSSLVNAGMLPMIEQGALWVRTGFERWRILGPMLPGKDPLAKLAEVLERGLIADPASRDTLARLKLFERDERALAFALRDAREDQGTFLLVVDQFEELFTFADDEPRRRFDAQLSNALHDPECPLFLLSTVRADFLDRYERLPRLLAIYNHHCKRYFLPTISEYGLREVIELPAKLAGLDVSEITTAILADARDEIGALPLVENTLTTLWEKRQGNCLSGQRYQEANGLAGMLSAQADALLAHIDSAVPKGRQAVLELLLRLTRVNDQGRHTRQRITWEEAVLVAGEGKDTFGERVVQMLSGERAADLPTEAKNGALRLLTISNVGPDDARVRYVDLIHETLIRAHGKDEKTGKPTGYWPTLYDYIEANLDRDLHRQHLKLQAEQWRNSDFFGHWWNLARSADLRRYSRLRIDRRSDEGRFLLWSRRASAIGAVIIGMALVGVAQLAWKANGNLLPLPVTLYEQVCRLVYEQRWRMGYKPLPVMVDIKPGKFIMGCLPGRDDADGLHCSESDEPHEVTLTKPCAIGQREVTFLEYGYFIWDQQHRGMKHPNGKEYDYPNDFRMRHADHPVTNISWDDAKAYAAWLSKSTDKNYRLPTEAEWEYAARAGTDTEYWWGNKVDKTKAICAGQGESMPMPAIALRRNPWGLYDMNGNVWEWVEDLYRPYELGAAIDPQGPQEGISRVLRGGGWGYGPSDCRAAYRHLGTQNYRTNFVGFRVCCGAPFEPPGAVPLDAGSPKP